MTTYQSSALTPEFNPRAIIESAKNAEQRGRQLQKNLEDYARLAEIQNQQMIADSENETNLLSTLSNFSKTALEFTEGRYRQAAKDIQTGIIYDQMVGTRNPKDDAEEQLEAEQGRLDSVDNAQQAEQIEASGDPVLADTVRTFSLSERAKGYRAQQADLLEAQGAYSPFIQIYLQNPKIKLNGTNLTLPEAISSGDPAMVMSALTQAQTAFFQNFKGGILLKATKDAVVKSLKGIIPSVNSATVNNLLMSAFKEKREGAQASVADRAFTIAKSGQISQESFDSLADMAWTSGAYATRQGATEGILKGLLQGLESSGNVDGIRQLQSIFKVRRADGTYQPGTQLGRQFDQLFSESIARAESQFEGDQASRRRAIEQSMYQRLQSTNSPELRDGIVENAAVELESIGLYEEARRLRTQKQGLTIDAAADANAALMSQQIKDGEIVSAGPIDQAVQAGFISQQKGQALKTELAERDSTAAPKDKGAKDIVDDFADRFDREFPAAVGLKRDQYGNLPDQFQGQTALISSGQAKLVLGAARRDMNLAANRYIAANPDMSPTQLRQGLSQVMAAWYKSNVQTQGGKYYIQDILDGQATAGYSTPTKRRDQIQAIATSPIYLNTPSNIAGSKPLNLSSSWTPDKGFSPIMAKNFNGPRGDIIFSKEDITTWANEYESSGKLNPQLVLGASQLRTVASPLALLQQQLLAHKLKPVSPSNYQQRAESSNPNMTELEQAEYLMSQGYTTKGAAYVIGGLTLNNEWLASAKETMEQLYGVPMSEITLKMRLDFALALIQKNDPKSYKVFTTAGWATDRQLKEAQQRVFGSNNGRSSQYAELIYRQLTP